jgi:hypothetical protein
MVYCHLESFKRVRPLERVGLGWLRSVCGRAGGGWWRGMAAGMIGAGGGCRGLSMTGRSDVAARRRVKAEGGAGGVQRSSGVERPRERSPDPTVVGKQVTIAWRKGRVRAQRTLRAVERSGVRSDQGAACGGRHACRLET